jgi:hypothetical protein
MFFTCGPVLAQYSYAPMAGDSGDDCYWMFQDGQEPVAMKGFDLTRETARSGLVELPEAPDGAAAISCLRSSPIPKLHDYETVLRGYPLLLRVPEGDKTTVVAVGVKDGQFYASIPQGTITSGQRDRLVERLDEFLDAYAELEQ